MKAVIQRVRKASVSIDGKETAAIGRGIAILLGITHADTKKDAEWLAEKCSNLRVFPDCSDKMSRSVTDEKGEILVVSQFTLYGNCTKGRKPDFIEASKPEHAEPLYNEFIEHITSYSKLKVAGGKFGAMMLVEIQNDGPVTLIVESKRNV